MSETYSIACVDCKEHLWIGQGRRDNDTEEGVDFYLYTINYISKALARFFVKHNGHELMFGNNCWAPMSRYTEIEPEREEDGNQEQKV